MLIVQGRRYNARRRQTMVG